MPDWVAQIDQTIAGAKDLARVVHASYEVPQRVRLRGRVGDHAHARLPGRASRLGEASKAKMRPPAALKVCDTGRDDPPLRPASPLTTSGGAEIVGTQESSVRADDITGRPRSLPRRRSDAGANVGGP
jgi:hypothetical protein